jgi:hypothetical protein
MPKNTTQHPKIYREKPKTRNKYLPHGIPARVRKAKK